MPDAGGLQDQAATWVDAVDLIGERIERHRAEDEERERRRQRREARRAKG
jgi:hypothetical protein